jgi:hypothetical protein
MPKYRVTYQVEKFFELDAEGIAENSHDKNWVHDTLYDLVRDDIVLSNEMHNFKFEEQYVAPPKPIDHDKLRKLFRGEQ